MTAEEFIEKQSYVILNPEYPLVEKTDALIAVKMAREEERKKACKAYVLVNEKRTMAERCEKAFSGIKMFKELLKELK